ncbi:MAG: hypothetical protein ABIM31_07345 [candidate division WOR-3 bacterium]
MRGYIVSIAMSGLLVLLNFGYNSLRRDLQNRQEVVVVKNYLKPEFEKWSAFEFSLIKAYWYLLRLRIAIGTYREKKIPFDDNLKRAIKNTAMVIVKLCPFYFDNYYIANGFLTWDFGDAKSANEILKEAIKYNPDNYVYYFYLGFNSFYFLRDFDSGAKYLLKATEISGDPRFAHLASRLLYSTGRTEVAIAVLENMLKNVKEEAWREQIEKRLKALKSFYYLQSAIEVYVERFGRKPTNLQELVLSGIIDRIPEDPYGGVFYIDENGEVRGTSKFFSK